MNFLKQDCQLLMRNDDDAVDGVLKPISYFSKSQLRVSTGQIYIPAILIAIGTYNYFKMLFCCLRFCSSRLNQARTVFPGSFFLIAEFPVSFF